MLKPKKGFVQVQLNIELLTPIQWDGIMKSMDAYAEHYHQEQSAGQNLYSVGDIKKIVGYISKNYSKIEDELAKPYEDKDIDFPDDFFDRVYDLCLNRAIESIK